jgi:hypothetical protein
MGDLRQEISRLRALTPQLNAATDRAAKIVLAVERFLDEECQLGLSAHIDIDENDPEERSWPAGTRMEYGRWEGKFRLIVADFETYPDGDTNITNRLPWAACTRDRKLSTISLIPCLLRRIAARIESTIKHANSQAGDVEGYLKELGIELQEGR